jgi:hypothetical protein
MQRERGVGSYDNPFWEKVKGVQKERDKKKKRK